MSFLYICTNPRNVTDETKIKLEFSDNISLITVDELKNRLITSQIKLPENYDLTFFARKLKSNHRLIHYGIKTGAYLFVIANELNQDLQIESSKEKKPKLEQQEIQKTIVAIRTALVNSNFRSMLNRLYDNEFRDNIIACTPGLKENIIAFAILQDPELMMICTDTENLSKISEKYFRPFVEAAGFLASAFHEEMVANSNNYNTIFGQENAYSMQNYASDDDDLEGGVDAAPPAGQQVRETQPLLQNRITSDMVQQAIQAAARSDLPSTSRQTNQTRDSKPNTNSLPSNSSSSSLFNTPSNQTEQTNRNWTQQLNTMRDLGLSNDAICIQALEASNGDVQEAINLYFILNNQGTD